jgi:hypothetical protein
LVNLAWSEWRSSAISQHGLVPIPTRTIKSYANQFSQNKTSIVQSAAEVLITSDFKVTNGNRERKQYPSKLCSYLIFCGPATILRRTSKKDLFNDQPNFGLLLLLSPPLFCDIVSLLHTYTKSKSKVIRLQELHNVRPTIVVDSICGKV